MGESRSDRLRMGESPRSDRPHTGESPRSDRPHTGESPRSDRPHTGESPRSDRSRMGESPRSDQSRMGESPRSDRPRTGESPRSDRSRMGKAPHAGRSHMGESPHSDRSHMRDSLGVGCGVATWRPRGPRPACTTGPSGEGSRAPESGSAGGASTMAAAVRPLAAVLCTTQNRVVPRANRVQPGAVHTRFMSPQTGPTSMVDFHPSTVRTFLVRTFLVRTMRESCQSCSTRGVTDVRRVRCWPCPMLVM